MADSISRLMNRMNRSERYRSVGKCIYCGTPFSPEISLTAEHIIPKSIGGRLVFEGASCQKCADQTHAFEGHALGVYRSIRRQLGFPQSLKKNKRLRAKTELFDLYVDGKKIKVPADDMPPTVLGISFPMPGIITGGTPEDAFLATSLSSIAPGPHFDEKLRLIKQKYHARQICIGNIDYGNRLYQQDFGRMLAKIGHSYAVAELGESTFEPYLNNIIRGIAPYYLPYYIGGVLQNADVATDLHEISIFDDIFTKDRRLVIVRIRLFAAFNTPAYFVVPGAFR